MEMEATIFSSQALAGQQWGRGPLPCSSEG